MTRNIRRDGKAYNGFKEAVELPLLVAALALIPVLGVPYLWDVGPGAESALNGVAWLIWAMFVIEYIVLFVLAPNRWQMVRTHLFDLLIIVLPFLRPLRAARSARLLRLLTISGRIGIGFRAVAGRRGTRFFLLGALGIVAVGAFITYAFERDAAGANIESFADALWWSVVTTTTVGYGDHFPLTAEGRAVAAVLMLVGIGMLGVVTANIAAFFIEEDDADEHQDLLARLERIEAMLVTLSAGGDSRQNSASEEFAAVDGPDPS